MSNEQIFNADTGAAIGALASYSINDGLNSPYPTEGTGTIPSANATVASDDPYEIIFETDSDVYLGGGYMGGAGDGGGSVNGHKYSQFFRGVLSGATFSDGSGQVSLSLDSEARKLNQEIFSPPLIGGGANILRNTFLYWFARCGIYRWTHPGKMLFQVNNTQQGYGYMNGRNWPLISRYSSEHNSTLWVRTGKGYPRWDFNVGKTLQYGVVLTRSAGTGSVVARINCVGLRTTGSFEDEVSHKDIGTFEVTANDTEWNVYLTDATGTKTLIKTGTALSGWNQIRLGAQAKRTSASGIAWSITANQGTSTVNSWDRVTATSSFSNFPFEIVPSSAYLANNGDFWGVDSIYVAESETELPTGDIYWNYGGVDVPTVTIPSGVVPVVPAFKGNVWQAVNELSTLYGTTFDAYKMQVVNTNDEYLNDTQMLGAAQGTVSSTVREKAETVEVVSYNYDASTSSSDYKEVWRADSVYSLDKGERQEHVITTDHSIVSLRVPYMTLPQYAPVIPEGEATEGYYTVFGADNSPVNASEWKSSGGGIWAEPTETPGEFTLIIQAPSEALTNAAPYTISLEGTMPYLIIVGEVARAEKRTLTAYTGAGDVPTKLGTTFDSPFVCGEWMGWNVAAGLSSLYGTTATDLRTSYVPHYDANYESPVKPYYVRKQGALYRTLSVSLSQGIYGIAQAVRYVRCKDFNTEYTGLTCGDYNTLMAGKTVKHANIAPLKRYLD